MQKRLIKLTALLIALSMLLAACGGNTPAPSTGSTASTGGTTTTTESTTPDATTADAPADSVDKTPITFTYYDEDAARDRPWTTPIAQKITELTGVSLQLQRPVGGQDVQIPLMVASGDYPDLIYGKQTGSAQLVEAGALIVLDDYIANSKYIKAHYGELLPRLTYSESDPHMYHIGARQIGNPVWEPTSAMPVQIAVLKEFDYPKIRTVYDLEPYLIEYKEKYPTIDGRPTYGFSLGNYDNWFYIIDVGNPSGLLAGLPDHGEWYVDEETLTASIKYLHPDVKEHFAWLNKMWNLGMIDPDCWTDSRDDWMGKIGNGQVLAILTPNWAFGDARATLRDAGGERLYAHIPLTYREDQTPVGTFDFGWSGDFGVGITQSCKDPDRAFEFLDWMASDESIVLREWGIEGVHYDVIDGKRVEKTEVRDANLNDPDYGNSQGFDWAYPFPQKGNGILDSTGSTYTKITPEKLRDNYTAPEIECVEAYGGNLWMDLFPPTSSFELPRAGAVWQIPVPTDSRLNEIVQLIQNTHLPRLVPQAIMAAPGEFDAKWDEYIAAVNAAGAEEAGAEMTELLRGKGRLWGTYP